MAGTWMAAPLLALREGCSPAAVGVLLALFALTQVFLALPAGRFADRHGLRRPVGYSVLAAVTGAGAAVAFPVLCLAALLAGLRPKTPALHRLAYHMLMRVRRRP